MLYILTSEKPDTVPHNVLLHKFWSTGIRGCLWYWFQSYLCSWLQTVSINNQLSNYLPIVSGVPQGSILGPLLFLVFINDLPTYINTAKLLLFADDTKCYSTPSSSSHLQKDTDNLYQWSLLNISFNSSKTSYLQLCPTSLPPPSDFFIANQAISQCSNHNNLGVVFTNDLSWSSHYNFIVSKALKTLGLIRRTIGTLSSVTVR